jgi:hypothetical protein
MMNTSVVQGLEQQLEDAKGLIARRNMALKLAGNHEFRTLILEGFCMRDCARFAQESADPALPLESRADAMAMAQAGGHLKRYLSAAFQLGAGAESSLGDLELNLEEARFEEANAEIHNNDAVENTDDTHGDLA